jgi:hypothetical protein
MLLINPLATTAYGMIRGLGRRGEPLYRADPERQWPAFGSAAYWADQ